jgi:hypothetical protein
VPVGYTSFEGDRLHLVAHCGRRVAVLVPDRVRVSFFGRRRLGWDIAAVWSIVDRLDATYDHYARITGREPEPGRNHQGRTTFAVVPSTCGAGCAYLGTQGIETLLPYWEALHNRVVRHGQFDQLPFYEMGRNFWFLGDKLGYVEPDDGGSVVTGYAVVNRFTSMEATGVEGGPWQGGSFADLRAAVHDLVDAYEASPSLTWERTLKVGEGVPGSGLGATDLFASFVMRLADYFGPVIHERIWREAAGLPDRETTADAVDNFVLAASAAGGRNLCDLFSANWCFPVSAAAVAAAERRWGPPWVRLKRQ